MTFYVMNGFGSFALSRPYAWISAWLIGFAAASLALASFWELFLGGFESLFLYVLLCHILEFTHRHAGRPDISRISFGLVFLLSLFIASYSVFSLVSFVFFAVFSYAYALKKMPLFGPVSFVFRGLTVLTQFFVSFFLFSQTISFNVILFASVIALLGASRNLIGDIRDIETDSTTFSAVFGRKKSEIVSAILIIFAIGLTIILNLFLLSAILLFFLLTIHLIKNGFLLHRIWVVGTTFFLAAFSFQTTRISWLFFLIPLDIIASKLFYKMIFRPANQKN